MISKTILSFLLATSVIPIWSLDLKAQVVLDNTLGTENSQIRSIDDLRSAIEGGAIRAVDKQP